jgi:rhodanese-related sulfurtransferase
MSSSIVIVADSDEKVSEAQLRLARVGLENINGYLAGGMKAWKEAGLELDVVPQINVAALKELIATQPDLQIVDVRRSAEYESGHAPNATSAPLPKLRELLPILKLRPGAQTAVICAGGYRSSAGTSILQQAGFTNLVNVMGGTKAWIDAGYEVEMPAISSAS